MTSDVREGGEWSKKQRIKNDLLFALISISLAITTRLPSSFTKFLGRALGLATWAFVPSWRHRATTNVERALPEITDRNRKKFVRRTFQNLGALLGETVATLNPRRKLTPLPFAPGSREILEAAIAEGRGVVFASAHLGPWERVAASLTMAGIPLTVVAREPYDPRLGRLYDRLRLARGVKTVYRGASSAGIALVRALRKGGVLGIPMDLASRAESIRSPFFGIPARTAIGPARLAIRTQAAVVVGTVAPSNKGDLQISFTRIPVTQGTSEADLTCRLNATLCQRIRALPSLWPWMHPRYDDGSNGEKGRPRQTGCRHQEVQAGSDGWIPADPHRREADA